MPRYELNKLGATEFENLVQALIKEIIGDGTVTFGAGPDGGREATFDGPAPYPSRVQNWDGSWIFQAKFHDTELLSTDKARKALLKDIDDELEKITGKYGRSPDNYVIATNVPLTPASDSGTLDQIKKVVFAKYHDKIQRFAIWGADDINRFLEKYPQVRTSYMHLIVPGDLIAWLLDERDRNDDATAITIQAYLQGMFSREQNAQLDQAGDVADEPVKIQQVFFELNAALRNSAPEARHNRDQFLSRIADFAKSVKAPGADGELRVPVVKLFLNENHLRVVLVGGPGEGKSTVGQYLAQLHRAQLVGEIEQVAISKEYYPNLPRLPFRVILRDFGQWLSESREAGRKNGDGSLEDFLCDQITRVTSRSFTTDALHDVLRHNPSLLILDGLDEVTDPALKKDLTERAEEFVARATKILRADLQVLATTRPTGYNEQFNPETYVHLNLVDLEPEQVRSYVDRWIAARELDDSRAQRLSRGIEDCLNDRQIRLLMNTPLQVTILVLIISAGGTPPRQREALFNEYLEVIYKREQGKGSDIIATNKELLVGLHKYIGYELQERATQASATDAILPADEYSRRVEKFIHWNDPYSPQAKRAAALRSITVDAGERLVLIVEPSAGRFGFELRSIQEFFAACHLVDTSEDTVQRYLRFEAIARLPHWQNVALFFAGRVGRNFPGEAANIVEACKNIDREGVDIYVRRGAQLALDIAFDQAFLPNRRLQRSILEVGLELLDSGLSWQHRDEVTALLLDMPDEDIQDHITPLLESRVSALTPKRAQDALNALTSVDPSSSSALEALRRMTDDPETRSEALLPLLRVARVSTNALPLLETLTSLLPPETTAAQLARLPHFEEYVRVIQLFCRAGVSKEVQLQAVRGAAFTRLIYTARRGARATTGSAWTGVWSQTGCELLLRAIETVGFWRIRVETPHRKAADGTDHDSLDEQRSLLPRTVIDGDSVAFASNASLASEDAAILAPFWCLHLIFGDVTAVTLQSAVAFCARNSDDEFVTRMMRGEWRLTPVLDYLVSVVTLKSQVNLADVAAPLLRWSGADGVRAWMTFKSHVAKVARQGRRVRRPSSGDEVLGERRPSQSARASQVSREALLEEAGNIELLLYTLSDPRRSEAFYFLLGDIDAQIDAAFETGILTSAKLRLIDHLSRVNGDRTASFEQREEILRRLTDLSTNSDDDALVSVLVSCYEAGRPEENLTRSALHLIGVEEKRMFYVGADPDAASSQLYKDMLSLVVNSGSPSVSRGACRIICSDALVRSYSSRASHRSPRFAGMARMHRELCERGDRDARMAAIALFIVRKSWGRNAKEVVRQLFVTCDSDVESMLLLRLIESEWQFEEQRHELWKEILSELLTETLFGELELEVRDTLRRFLQTADQSLANNQTALALPLVPEARC